jgi:hypothetical protein
MFRFAQHDRLGDLPGILPLGPLLQFNNIAFRISRIHNPKTTNPIYFCCCDVSHCAAASPNYRLQRLIHVFDRKRDMRETALVRCWEIALYQLLVTENLKCRTIIAIAR